MEILHPSGSLSPSVALTHYLNNAPLENEYGRKQREGENYGDKTGKGDNEIDPRKPRDGGEGAKDEGIQLKEERKEE
jgi:hypothetical protein